MLELDKSIVAILNDSHSIIGTGFAAGEQLILTCAHVVLQAGSGPGKMIIIRFHVNGEIQSAQVDAEYWSPVEENDISVLRLSEQAPKEVIPLPLSKTLGSEGHPLRAFGYPKLGDFVGIWASGEIKGMVQDTVGKKMLQLESIDIAKGSSGGAVLDLHTEKVIGMVSLAYHPGPELHHIGTAFATPVDVLLQVCPELVKESHPNSKNPFFAGGAVPPELFVGRTSPLHLLQMRLSGGYSLQSVSIVGERRMGKSSLLHYVCERANELFPEIDPVLIYLDLMKGYCHTRKGFTKALRLAIKEKLGNDPWTAEDDENLEVLSFAFEKLSKEGIKLILCLDEIENLTKRKAEFDELLEELRAAGQISQIGMITASARPLADLCINEKLLSPFYNIFVQDTLGLLEKSEWQELISNHMAVSNAELDSIDWLAGGHPFYSQICAGRLWESHNFSPPSDWIRQTLLDVEPHWLGWWNSSTDDERSVLRASVGLLAPKSQENTLEKLTRRGLIRAEKPFSEAFGEWIKRQG